MNRTAIILGSTGLTGKHLLQMLLDCSYYNRVISFVRKESGVKHEKLAEYIINFDKPELYRDLVKGDDLYCCLGTTIKKARSREAFEKIDAFYPAIFADIAAKNNVKQFLIISSTGANIDSSNFYLRTKGKCEEAIQAANIPSISIFRPSLLLGERKESRPAEKISQGIMPLLSVLMIGKLKRYRPVKVKIVAQAMFVIARQKKEGIHIYESEEIGVI